MIGVLKKYICSVCGYIYDEAQQGPWAALPESWVCPLCKAPKSAFRLQSEPADLSEEIKTPPSAEKLRELEPGELCVLCTNLAKGCEKQYLPAQAELFQKLAAYYGAKAAPEQDAQFDQLIEKVRQDLDETYPAADAAARAQGDRGALRALVWSEKVTRMLQALLTRYQVEQDEMLAGTNVYVCEICGFIYVGDEPPTVCPVCKVPSFKLAKQERG